MLCAHHALTAHGAAVSVIREYAETPPQVGFAPVGDVKIPATDSDDDIKAAYEETFRVMTRHYLGNAIWIDPIMKGEYEPELMEFFEKNKIKITKEDIRLIGEPVDFIGMYTYTAGTVCAAGSVSPAAGFEQTAMDWEITPDALYWLPRFL